MKKKIKFYQYMNYETKSNFINTCTMNLPLHENSMTRVFKIMRLLKFLHSWFVLRILCLIIFLDSSPKSNISSHTTTPYRSKDDRQLANMGRKLLLTHEKVQAESESMLESANKVSVWRKLSVHTNIGSVQPRWWIEIIILQVVDSYKIL